MIRSHNFPRDKIPLPNSSRLWDALLKILYNFFPLSLVLSFEGYTEPRAVLHVFQHNLSGTSRRFFFSITNPHSFVSSCPSDDTFSHFPSHYFIHLSSVGPSTWPVLHPTWMWHSIHGTIELLCPDSGYSRPRRPSVTAWVFWQCRMLLIQALLPTKTVKSFP